MSSRASADSATVRKGVAASSEPLAPHSVHVSLVPRAVKAIQAKKRKGKTAKKPPENKPRYVREPSEVGVIWTQLCGLRLQVYAAGGAGGGDGGSE